MSHRLSTTKKETIFPSELGFVCSFQRSCLHNSHIRCCLQFRELGGFVRREWNAFGRLRQALIHIQTTNALGPRPRPSSTHTQPFRPGKRNLKHRDSPCAYYCSGPQTIRRFGTNTSGDDCCTLHRAGKDTKSSGSPGLSTANTFIPCGVAICFCGLTSISAI